jgi:hypothetical protein
VHFVTIPFWLINKNSLFSEGVGQKKALLFWRKAVNKAGLRVNLVLVIVFISHYDAPGL